MNNLKKRLAAIDIGTNSFRMLIVEVEKSSGKFKILRHEREVVRLGEGFTDMKHLSEASMNKGIETLRNFKIIADALNAEIRATATSAVREALNQDEFIKRVRSETGIKVETISGIEEARLIYLGILQSLPVFNNKILLIDIGGGSTEFLVGQKCKIEYDNTLKLGAVRLTHRFFESNTLSLKKVKECRKYITGVLSPIIRTIKTKNYNCVIGTSGTILSIASMIQATYKTPETTNLNNFTFTNNDLLKIIKQLIKTKNTSDRSEISGLDHGRADIIVAGALILEQIFKELKIKKMTVSEFSLKEGLILDTIQKKYNLNKYFFENIRPQSIQHLAETFAYEKSHAKQTSKLALLLFDQLNKVHKLGLPEREFLESASLLHDIGFFISHEQHHRHSYYLIRNAELLGFTENEKEIIANISRYHRKSHPKLKHDNFTRLSSEDQEIVKKLSAILRIADGLDRTHTNAVRNIKCKIQNKKIAITIYAHRNHPVKLEIWAAEIKKKLFEDVFEKSIKFKSR